MTQVAVVVFVFVVDIFVLWVVFGSLLETVDWVGVALVKILMKYCDMKVSIFRTFG
jgi:hypothetical protein